MKFIVNLFIIFFVSFSTPSLLGQLVTSSPVFPTSNETVTLFFRSDLGSGGLAGYNGEIYAHIGVITTASNAPSDWKYVKTNWGENTPETKMTKTRQFQYQLTLSPTIRDYFGVPENEEILQIAMVMRSDVAVNGSYLEGKAAEGGDIFLDIFDGSQGLQVIRVTPTENNLLVEAGSSVNTSEESTIRVFDNEVEIFIAENTTSYNETITAEAEQKHTIRIEINANDETISSSFTYLPLQEAMVQDLPEGAILGLELIDEITARFVLEGPSKGNALILSNISNWNLSDQFWMNKTEDGQFFWLEMDIASLEGPLMYQYIVDGQISIADPFSEVILDMRNDGSISQSVYPNLPNFPEQANGSLVSLCDDFSFDWQVNDYSVPEQTELIIYELLMRDLLESHSYNDLIDTLSYLKRLGVNAIELMPINEFEGNDSWGYNPSFHGAVDKYYGDPVTFKKVVDECHRLGIAVILDVVFNHVFSQSPLAQLYWDAENFRPTVENPWLNVEARHPFNVGYDVNHESENTQRWMDRILSRWITEYRIDGFRFDLSKGFTQVNNPNNVSAWGNYDASRIVLLKRLADEIWSHDPAIYVILEHFADNTEEKELAEYGTMLWGNMNHNYGEASMGYTDNGNSDLSGGIANNRNWDVNHLITYMESHDEERQMYRNLNFGNSSGNYSTRDEQTALDRIELINVFFYMLPGPKMLWQFGEMAFPYSINTCRDGNVSDNCRLDPKPIEWELQEQEGRDDLIHLVRDLIYLKNHYSTFNDGGELKSDLRNGTKSIVLDGPSLDAVVVGNFEVTTQEINVDFTQVGKWYGYFERDSMDISSIQQMFSLEPGGYRVYLSQNIDRISQIDIISSSKDLIHRNGEHINIFPNPIAGNKFSVDLSQTDFAPTSLKIIDGKGLEIPHLPINSLKDTVLIQLKNNVPDGLYIIKLESETGIYSKPIIISRN